MTELTFLTAISHHDLRIFVFPLSISINDHREKEKTQFKKSCHFKSDVVRNSSDILKIQAHGDYLEFDLDTNVLPCDYFYRREEYPEVKLLSLN